MLTVAASASGQRSASEHGLSGQPLRESNSVVQTRAKKEPQAIDIAGL
jgi:hypothetical protein